MHEYSIDVEENRIIFGLAVISIVISIILSFLINAFLLTIPFIEFSVSIATMGIFGVLYAVFDKHIWKWKFLRKIGILHTPNLNGVWKGSFLSSYFEFEKSIPAELIIEQTWTKISVKGKFKYSKSSSDTASLKVNDGGGVKLFYSYLNDKYPEHYKMDINNHRGYGSLEIIDDSMEGNYFNDPSNNNNHGKLIFKFSSHS